ncbi:MAG: pyridoxal phosphate-dependent aminotransferase [Chloroflexota bacterium]|nr:pyridoxal phosphate-dependent aminotransferase [Chloroflexota bacterium]
MPISGNVSKSMEEGSWIRRMFEVGIAMKLEYGSDKVFDLSLGNPIVEPPDLFKQELMSLAQSLDKGMHRYMPNAGYPETRASVANMLSAETGLPFTYNEIVMACGAAGAANVVLRTILNPDDEVVILAPYFGEYIYYIDNHRGIPVVVNTDQEFQLNIDSIKGVISERTRAIIINSPNNPSGAIYPDEDLTQLCKMLYQKQEEYGTEIFIISDEPYRRLIYDGLPYPQIFPHYQNTIIVNSHAKDLGLPGERIGYIAVHPSYKGKEELVDGFIFCTRTLGFVNAPALMQHVVRSLQGLTVDISDYQRKRDYLYGRLTDLGYSVVKPQGAFYLLPKSPLADDVAFVDALQSWNVLTVPGRGFGTPGHFRISYCVEDWVLAGAVEGFARAADKFL